MPAFRKLIKSGERSKSPSIVKNFEARLVLSMVLAVSGKSMSCTVRMTQVQLQGMWVKTDIRIQKHPAAQRLQKKLESDSHQNLEVRGPAHKQLTSRFFHLPKQEHLEDLNDHLASKNIRLRGPGLSSDF